MFLVSISEEMILCADSKSAEEATEATEASAESDRGQSARGAYTEHIFTDPLGAQQTAEALSFSLR